MKLTLNLGFQSNRKNRYIHSFNDAGRTGNIGKLTVVLFYEISFQADSIRCARKLYYLLTNRTHRTVTIRDCYRDKLIRI